MSLRAIAETDLGRILEDNTRGFGWPLTITSPAQVTNTEPLYGFSTDIGQLIDPDTGQIVSGRYASVAIRISRLAELGFSLPEGVSDSEEKPWLVRFNDINGTEHVFKVIRSLPDRAAGLVVCILGRYL